MSIRKYSRKIETLQAYNDRASSWEILRWRSLTTPFMPQSLFLLRSHKDEVGLPAQDFLLVAEQFCITQILAWNEGNFFFSRQVICDGWVFLQNCWTVEGIPFWRGVHMSLWIKSLSYFLWSEFIWSDSKFQLLVWSKERVQVFWSDFSYL